MKRRISFLLVLALLLGMIPVNVFAADQGASTELELAAPAVVAASASGYWKDYAADGFAGGSGTKEDPFLIATAEQLARFLSSPAVSVLSTAATVFLRNKQPSELIN